jgi:hypothetical protein
LIEFGRLRLPARRDDGSGLEAGFREGERCGGRAMSSSRDEFEQVGLTFEEVG